jgi:hypothetical protein
VLSAPKIEKKKKRATFKNQISSSNDECEATKRTRGWNTVNFSAGGPLGFLFILKKIMRTTDNDDDDDGDECETSHFLAKPGVFWEMKPTLLSE